MLSKTNKLIETKKMDTYKKMRVAALVF